MEPLGQSQQMQRERQKGNTNYWHFYGSAAAGTAGPTNEQQWRGELGHGQ